MFEISRSYAQNLCLFSIVLYASTQLRKPATRGMASHYGDLRESADLGVAANSHFKEMVYLIKLY